MARARNLKPGFFRNADLVELPFEARLLFAGLWTLADRAGRLEDRPKQIKMDVFPADTVDCNDLLDQLAATNMVARYSVNGKRYLQVVNFNKHQNPHKDEKASTIPDQYESNPNIEQTPKKNGVSTVQAPCKDDAATVAIVLTPDPRSLTADPLIPENQTTHTAASGEAVGEKTSVCVFPDRPIFDEAGDVLPPIADEPPAEDQPGSELQVMSSMPAAICLAMKAVGMASVSPSHAELPVLLEGGADIGMFVAAARIAVKGQKGFGYALGIVKSQLLTAKNLADQISDAQRLTGMAGSAKVRLGALSFAERDRIAGMQRWEESCNQRHPDLPEEFSKFRTAGQVIDITPNELRISQ